MNAKKKSVLQVEALPDRIMPSASAVFSNGLLLVRGDNQGDNLMVSADQGGVIHVTERGQAVTITGATATTANTKFVTEQSGSGRNNTLATDKSLGGIANYLDATRGTNNTLNPGNRAPSTEIGGHGSNHLIMGPGGMDVLIGGADRSSTNLFDWQPGTGTDVVIGRGGHNTLLVVGNNAGQAENDEVDPDGQGGFVYQRNDLVPFKIFATNVDSLIIQPSTGNNTVTVNDLSGVDRLKRIEVDGLGGNNTFDFSQQRNAAITAVFNGGSGNNTFVLGAGPNRIVGDSSDDTIMIPPDSGPVYGLPKHK